MTVDRNRLRELALAATPGPYFVGSDDAEECGPHANSGLSLVDTGRREDWPIARLCESASAAWIAATDPQTILALLDALEAAAQQPTPPMQNDALMVRLLHPKHEVPTTRERAEMIEAMREAAERIRALEADAKFQHQAADDMLRITADLSDQLAASRERERAIREAIKCDHDGEPCGDGVCCHCGEPYETRNESDDGPYLCDPCAQDAIGRFRALATPDSAASPTRGE